MPQLSTPQGLLEKLRGLNFFWNKIVETLCHIMLDVSLSSFFTYLHIQQLFISSQEPRFSPINPINPNLLKLM